MRARVSSSFSWVLGELVLRLAAGERTGGRRDESDDQSGEDRREDEGAWQRHGVH